MIGESTTAESAHLWAPGGRLGWTFRDPRRLASAFPEPYPQPASADRRLETHLTERYRMYRTLRSYLGWMILSAAIIVGLAAPALTVTAMDPSIGYADRAADAGWAAFTAALALALGTCYGFLVYKSRRSWLDRTFAEMNAARIRDCEDRRAAWAVRKVAHDRAQAALVARAYQWFPVAIPGGRRLDVVGGTPDGWRALLCVYGTSLLCERPVVVLDLSEGDITDALAGIATAAGRRVREERLPARLAESAACADLTAPQLIDILVAGIHSGDDSPGGRADRTRDNHLLTGLARALDGDVTVGRLAAAVRVLMDETAIDPRLRPDEAARIRAGALTGDNLDTARAALSGLAAWLQPLRDLGSRRTPVETADLTCVTVTGRHNPSGELLTELVVQDVTQHVAALAARRPATAVIVAAAEAASPEHIARLADAARRHGVPLTLLFRHLRRSSRTIGDGAVGFMRLANHADATEAAEAIGVHRTFVLSSMTQARGGNEAVTTGTTEGTTRTSTTSRQIGVSADPVRLTAGLNAGAGVGRSDALSRSWTRSQASGTAWEDATTFERSKEYVVEAAELRRLSDLVMLLTEPAAPGAVTPVELNPEIAGSWRADPGPARPPSAL